MNNILFCFIMQAMENNKNKNNKKNLIKLGAVLVGIVAFALIATDSRMKVVHYSYHSDKIDKPFKIAHITDLHSCDYGEGQKYLIDAIDIEKPDFIVLTGDIFEEDLPDKKSKEFIEGVKGRYPIYYVTGNHEYYSGRVPQIITYLESAGVHVLRGRGEKVEVNGNEIVISGLEDNCMDWLQGKGSHFRQMNRLIGATDRSKFNILLAHRPYLIEEYAKGGYELVMCGHSHGGQFRIPYLLNGFIEPDQGLFPKYAGGRYEVGETTLILSRGLARESTRFVPRIFNRPELVFVDVD